MKILIDMNLSPRWETVLAAEGISSAHFRGEKPSVIQIRSEDVSPEAAAKW